MSLVFTVVFANTMNYKNLFMGNSSEDAHCPRPAHRHRLPALHHVFFDQESTENTFFVVDSQIMDLHETLSYFSVIFTFTVRSLTNSKDTCWLLLLFEYTNF